MGKVIKKTILNVQRQILPNTKKEMLKLLQNPEAMKNLFKLIKTSNDLIDNQKILKAQNMLEWEIRCIQILPDNLKCKQKFTNGFKEFLNNFNYNNEETYQNKEVNNL